MLRRRFRGGVHPHDAKQATASKSIENSPLPDQVIIPLQQHIGAPAEPVVQKGDTVKTGQMIGKASGFVSVPVHASVSGEVTAVSPCLHPTGVNVLSVTITSDHEDAWINLPEKPVETETLSQEAIIESVNQAGITGMGGASFPTHVKLSPPKGKTIDTLLINGVECEPYLTSDHRLMLEKPDEIIQGIKLLMTALNVNRAIIGIEKNKPDAIRIMQEKVRLIRNVSVLGLPVMYPQGGEKQLIKAALNREVPSGGLPLDIGCVVQNVGTTLAVYDAVVWKKPLIERIVTVTGPGIQNPKNLRVRIGASFKTLIDACGGYTDHDVKVINGGPMMGIAQVSDDVPVIKGTSGILVLDKTDASIRKEQACISCARCVDICPMQLVPSRIATFVEYKRYAMAEKLGLFDCMECGSCSFICPANRNLVHYIKLGKTIVTEQKRKTG